MHQPRPPIPELIQARQDIQALMSRIKHGLPTMSIDTKERLSRALERCGWPDPKTAVCGIASLLLDRLIEKIHQIKDQEGQALTHWFNDKSNSNKINAIWPPEG